VTDLEIRRATAADVPLIVAMLADDPLGATREKPGELDGYLRAFGEIDGDPRQHLVIALRDGKPAGTLQLTLITGLSRSGATRAVIEAVRVHRDMRGEGVGTDLIQWAISTSRELGASLVQLTSDVTRGDAHRFYARLGFEQSHVGFKMPL
jgi:GNAT superfamily N-acetyltransferase